MPYISIGLDERLLEDANKIVDEVGLDLQAVVKMVLKRVVRENSIAFIVSKNPETYPEKEDRSISHDSGNHLSAVTVPIQTSEENLDKVNMTKSMAVRLLRSRGYDITKNVTFASKNRVSSNYWANPDFGLLDGDWNLILNDWLTKKLYLFFIPAHTINYSELIPRNDKNTLIDLQIMYMDPTFTDNRSDYSFSKFLIGEIYY